MVAPPMYSHLPAWMPFQARLVLLLVVLTRVRCWLMVGTAAGATMVTANVAMVALQMYSVCQQVTLCYHVQYH